MGRKLGGGSPQQPAGDWGRVPKWSASDWGGGPPVAEHAGHVPPGETISGQGALVLSAPCYQPKHSLSGGHQCSQGVHLSPMFHLHVTYGVPAAAT